MTTKPIFCAIWINATKSLLPSKLYTPSTDSCWSQKTYLDEQYGMLVCTNNDLRLNSIQARCPHSLKSICPIFSWYTIHMNRSTNVSKRFAIFDKCITIKINSKRWLSLTLNLHIFIKRSILVKRFSLTNKLARIINNSTYNCWYMASFFINNKRIKNKDKMRTSPNRFSFISCGLSYAPTRCQHIKSNSYLFFLE